MNASWELLDLLDVGGQQRIVRLIDRVEETAILSLPESLPGGDAEDITVSTATPGPATGPLMKLKRLDLYFASAPSGVEMLVSQGEHDALVAAGAMVVAPRRCAFIRKVS